MRTSHGYRPLPAEPSGMCAVPARRGEGVRGQWLPGARGRGREKRVVAAKEGGDKYEIYDTCTGAPETLAPPMHVLVTNWL
jgi:hypothetical protein